MKAEAGPHECQVDYAGSVKINTPLAFPVRPRRRVEL